MHRNKPPGRPADYAYGDIRNHDGIETKFDPNAPTEGGDTFIDIQEGLGGAILASNYWKTSFAVAGGMFLSLEPKSRTARLLVPAMLVAEFENEVRGARRVQIDLGPAVGGNPNFPPHAYRLIFDDRSDSPFFVLVGPGQFDRVIPGREHGSALTVIVYGPGPRVLARLPATFRRVAHLPEI